MPRLTVTHLESIKDKSIGLIGKKTVTPIYFTTRWGIHTFGVLSPIDVLILDDENRVVKLRNNLFPNRLFFWNPKYERVIELPGDTIRKEKIAVGNQVSLKIITPADRRRLYH